MGISGQSRDVPGAQMGQRQTYRAIGGSSLLFHPSSFPEGTMALSLPRRAITKRPYGTDEPHLTVEFLPEHICRHARFRLSRYHDSQPASTENRATRSSERGGWKSIERRANRRKLSSTNALYCIRFQMTRIKGARHKTVGSRFARVHGQGFLRGRPCGRKVDSKQKRLAVRPAQRSSPNGRPRATLTRIASNSASV